MILYPVNQSLMMVSRRGNSTRDLSLIPSIDAALSSDFSAVPASENIQAASLSLSKKDSSPPPKRSTKRPKTSRCGLGPMLLPHLRTLCESLIQKLTASSSASIS